MIWTTCALAKALVPTRGDASHHFPSASDRFMVGSHHRWEPRPDVATRPSRCVRAQPLPLARLQNAMGGHEVKDGLRRWQWRRTGDSNNGRLVSTTPQPPTVVAVFLGSFKQR